MPLGRVSTSGAGSGSGIKPLPAYANTDQADIQTQLESLKLVLANRVCKRGWCCWRSNAPCKGRTRTGSSAMLVTMSRASQSAPPTVDGTGYHHHADEEIIPEDLRLQMEYAVAVAFLESCYLNNIKEPRPSDELLEYMDEFVQSDLTKHPAFSSGPATLKDSAMNRELRIYLGMNDNRTRLHVSHGALILAAIYLRLVKLEEILGNDKVVIAVPVYVCEEEVYTMVMRQQQEGDKDKDKEKKVKKDKKPSALSRLFSPRVSKT